MQLQEVLQPEHPARGPLHRRLPGGAVRDYRVFAAPTAAGLPEPAEIVAEVRALADDVTARARAETIENYTGPVLLEGRASPQFFHALLGRFLGGTPAPVVAGRATAPPRRLDPLFGQRVLPAGFGIVDDPTRAQLAGVALLGRYAIDEEGVAPHAVRVVDDGMMRAWLFSRIPARADDRSTGHGRDSSSGEVRPIIGNLIVEAATTVPAAELRRDLLRLAQERGLGYGIVVRGLEDLGMLPPRPAARPARSELPPPVAVYRVLPDGRMMALVRCSWGTDNAASIGVSTAPYKEWTWTSAGTFIGGPNFLPLPDGRIFGGGRYFRQGYGKDAVTVLAKLTPASYERLLELPSGGDNSYPGFVWHDGLLWMLYYSSHEGKASIYLAKIKL